MKIPAALLILTALLTSGCGTFKPQRLPQEVKIITEQVAVEIYQPRLPQEIQMEPTVWFVITEDNLEEKLAEIKQFQGGEVVIFGMTPQSYENMAANLQELRRYIRQQTQIILYYREATQLNEDINNDGIVNKDDWAEKNKKLLQSNQ